MSEGYIGLDAHKERIEIGLSRSGELRNCGGCSSDLGCFMRALRRLQKREGLGKEDLRICYEAGPTGFTLARHLLRMGYHVDVIAPSHIPKRSGDRVKTDRRDALKLARLYAAGELVAVHIPDSGDEVMRDLCRARTDAVDDRRRAKLRLGAFLLRNGHHYTGRVRWSEAHWRYLRELVLIDPIQKLILEEYLQAIDLTEQRVGSIEAHMRLQLGDWSRRLFVEALQGFRGMQLVASMVVASELGDLRRFAHPRKLMAYLGLVPSENSSGGTRRQGSITKTGNTHVRWMLVEVVASCRYAPKVSKQLSVRQEGLSREIRAISWKAQKRLHGRYLSLHRRRLHDNKIKVALAREMAGFIWELGQMPQFQIPNAEPNG